MNESDHLTYEYSTPTTTHISIIQPGKQNKITLKMTEHLPNKLFLEKFHLDREGKQ